VAKSLTPPHPVARVVGVSPVEAVAATRLHAARVGRRGLMSTPGRWIDKMRQLGASALSRPSPCDESGRAVLGLPCAIRSKGISL
jgi:hypothetical protein